MPFTTGQAVGKRGRPKGGSNYKRLVRVEKAVRLELLGLKDAEIAEHLRMGVPGLALLKRGQDYKLLKQELLTGVISDYHDMIKADSAYIRHRLRSEVPRALDTLVQAAQLRGSPQNMRVAVDAAKTILDRDGRFAAVSRIGLPTDAQGGVASTKDNDMASALAHALASQKQVEVVEKEPPSINDAPPTSSVM